MKLKVIDLNINGEIVFEDGEVISNWCITECQNIDWY